MKKDFVFKVNCNGVDRKDLIDFAMRCEALGQKSDFYGCLYHYDVLNDRLCLDKINLSNKVRLVIVPEVFDCLSSHCFYLNDVITEIDASQIKYCCSDAISFCYSLKSINLKLCNYFEDNSISDCTELRVIHFAKNIDYLGKSFISNSFSFTTYNLFNVNNLHDEAFNDDYMLSNIKINVNYIKKLPCIYSKCFEIEVKDCDSLDDKYYSIIKNRWVSVNPKEHKIKFLGNKEKFMSLLEDNIKNAVVFFE